MERSSLVLSIVAVVFAISAVVLALLLPGQQGPMGPQGPTGAQGPEGPAWTPSVVQLEWTIAPNWDNKETIYLDEGDILEGSVSTAQPLGPVGPYKWSLSIFDLVVWDIVRMYPADYTIDFRYVAQSSGKHEIWVFNEQAVAADATLDYWIIKS